jgi:hypothetical protein
LGSRQIISNFTDLRFTSLSGLTASVTVDPDVRGWIFPERHDLVVLPIVGEPSGAFKGLPSIAPSALTPMQPIYLVGINPIVQAIANSDGNDSLLSGATITLAAPCRVVGVDGGRLSHNCETEKQMSGSPMFAVGNNGPGVVAVHVAGDDAPSPLQVCGPTSWPVTNHAVLLPSE